MSRREKSFLFDNLEKYPHFKRLFRYYSKQMNINLLKEYLSFTKKYRALANIYLEEAMNETNVNERNKKLREFDKNIKNVENCIDDRLNEEHNTLLKLQIDIAKELEFEGIIGSTLNQTFYFCLINLHKPKAKEHAIKIKKFFDIPEKRYWRIKINALSFLEDWNGLYNFSLKNGEGNSPVGYVPFVEACFIKKEYGHGKKYLELVSDNFIKVEFYLFLKMWKEAIESAASERSIELLNIIKSKTDNPKTHQTIDEIIDELN
jgi:vacuolar protein sorting-associated protein 16